MGTRGQKPAKAIATPAGWVEYLSDRRDEIETETGVTLSDATWKKIDRAYRVVMIARKIEEQSIAVNDRGRDGWKSQHAASMKYVEKALELLIKQREKRDFNAVVDRAQDRPFRRDLQAAIKQVKELVHSLRAAETQYERHDVDLTEAKKRTVQDITDAVADEIPIEFPEVVRQSGLTDFQHFIKALKIHEANSDQAFAKWLSRALIS